MIFTVLSLVPGQVPFADELYSMEDRDRRHQRLFLQSSPAVQEPFGPTEDAAPTSPVTAAIERHGPAVCNKASSDKDGPPPLPRTALALLGILEASGRRAPRGSGAPGASGPAGFGR